MIADREVPGHPVQRGQEHARVITHDQLPVVSARRRSIGFREVSDETGIPVL